MALPPVVGTVVGPFAPVMVTVPSNAAVPVESVVLRLMVVRIGVGAGGTPDWMKLATCGAAAVSTQKWWKSNVSLASSVQAEFKRTALRCDAGFTANQLGTKASAVLAMFTALARPICLIVSELRKSFAMGLASWRAPMKKLQPAC